MSTRRGHHSPHNRNMARHSTTSQPSGLVSAHTFTLIASWRGQLLICTIVILIGAVYWVVREPVSRWRQRQRERISRALGEELLQMERKNSSTGAPSDDKTPTAATSTVVAKEKNARDRGRERRKELKKRNMNLSRPANSASSGPVTQSNTKNNTTDDSSPKHTSSADSLPSLATPAPSDLSGSVSTSEDRVESRDEPDSNRPSSSLKEVPTEQNTVTLESSQSESENVPSTAGPVDSPAAETSQVAAPVAESPSQPVQEVDLSNYDNDDVSVSDWAEQSSRPSHTRTASSYSIMPESSYLPQPTPPQHGKKKKRKSKARSALSGSETRMSPDLGAVHIRGSSDDLSASPPMAPGSPRSRHSRKTSHGGVVLNPSLELLLENNERTIDSLRAEIGQAKAEESKAREDEGRAREELRRSRVTEDRMRADYERSRKARDRADGESRRLESELFVMRSRFDTLTHMYIAVCSRLREFEIAAGRASELSGAQSPVRLQHPAGPAGANGLPGGSGVSGLPSSPSPFMAYPSQNQAVGFTQYQTHIYSPAHHHGLAVPSVSAYPQLRRPNGSAPNSDMLAGPLSPGFAVLGTPTSQLSQVSSPHPSDLSSMRGAAATPAESLDGQLTAAELRRLNIASSVLKKKSDSNLSSGGSRNVSQSTTGSADSSSSSPTKSPHAALDDAAISGLGIANALSNVASAFPSSNNNSDSGVAAGGVSPLKLASKLRSTSAASSDASSPLPGCSTLVTPESEGVFPVSMSLLDGAPAAVEETAKLPRNSNSSLGMSVHLTSIPEKAYHVSNGNSNTSADEGLTVSPVDYDDGDDDVEYTPLFASLAHTPEQLAEIARVRDRAALSLSRKSSSSWGAGSGS